MINDKIIIKTYFLFNLLFTQIVKNIDGKEVKGFIINDDHLDNDDGIEITGDVFIIDDSKFGAFVKYLKNPVKYNRDIMVL